MSDLIEREPEMSPQVSPKDIPREGQNSESEEEEPAAIILEGSTSSDEDGDEVDNDDEGYTQGYVPLSQDEAELQIQDQTVTESEGASSEVQSSQVTGCSEGSSVSGTETLSPSSRDVKMEQAHVDLIRQVMSGITLPSSAVPDWAKNVPEEKWKASLVTSITNRTQMSSDSGTKK